MGIRGNIDFEYDLAVRQGNVRRLRTLIKHKAKPPQRLMLFALIRKHPELLDILNEAGANPNDVDGFNETALGHAINYYPTDIVEKLLALGADPNKESLHLLPLIIAASRNNTVLMKLLVSKGADPNKRQWNGLTPLLAVVRHGQLDATRILLEAGGNPTIKGPGKLNATEIAKQMKRQDIVKALEEKPATARRASKAGVRRTKMKNSK